MPHSPNKKISVLLLVTLFISAQLFGFFIPAPAHAQLTVTVVSDIERTIKDIGEKLKVAAQISAKGALIQATTFFLNKIAYETAVLIATAGPGQKSLIAEKGFGDFLVDTAGDAAADGISELGKPFGLNLCQFPSLNFQVFLQIGIGNLNGIGSPQPDCTWQQFTNAWDPNKFAAKFGGNAAKFIAEKFSANLSVKNSDFGLALGAIGRVDALQASVTDGAKNQRLEGGGVEPLTDAITGKIKTPASLVDEELKGLSATDRKALTAEQLAAAYNDAAIEVMLPNVATVFLNTLTSQLLKRLLTQGLLPSTPSAGGFSPDVFGIIQNTGHAVAQAFSRLFAPRLEKPLGFDMINNFATCPDRPGLDNCVIDPDFRAALDHDRLQGLPPLTIAEAVGRGLLHGDWPIISPRNEVKNTNTRCFANAYCYSNIQKLRKARIVPLGFEIAAQKANPDKPPTLQDVLDGFDRCGTDLDAASQFCHLLNPNWVLKVPDMQCYAQVNGPELVDPSGPVRRAECVDLATCVLEDSTGKCQGKFGFCTKEKNVWRIPGESCEEQYATCKTYTNDETGNQASYLSRTLEYGECTADTVGCRAYSTAKDTDGEWSHASLAFFNKSILDSDHACPGNGSANGCNAFYSAVKYTDGTYPLENGNFYPGGVGDFMRASTTVEANLTYLKKAPEYLGCYDADLNTAGRQWPETLSEAQTLENRGGEACAEYAPACAPAEVGCESYTPITRESSVTIPGIIGSNLCDASCVGYDTFRQEALESGWDTEAYPLYFIPDAPNVRRCDRSSVGCEEFTNLDTVAAGGEGLEYYTRLKYCEKPDGTNERSYYSLEGSAVEGYKLKVHRLLQVDTDTAAYLSHIQPVLTNLDETTADVEDVFPIGSPAYDNDTKEQIEENYELCNAMRYDNRVATDGTGEVTEEVIEDGVTSLVTRTVPISGPDCQALYDDTGTIYYRLVSRTVTVDESCHPLRKTVPILALDEAIVDSGICAQRGGVWDLDDDTGRYTCQRCVGGGRFIEDPASPEFGGYCQYQTISALGEGESCSAVFAGCRAYVGNTGNNRQIVFTDTFETSSDSDDALLAANPGWDNGSIVSEALRVSEHSLSVNVSTVSRLIPGGLLQAGDTYEITFWAKSTASKNLAIQFEQESNPPDNTSHVQKGVFTYDPLRQVESRVTIGNSWQEYHLGPVTFAGETAASTTLPTYLVFASDNSGTYFIDNVELTRLQDYEYLIKDSWQESVTLDDGRVVSADVPLACDAEPEDTNPGAALGCAEYKDSKGTTAYATGFDALCREAAVGCEPLWDTYNTLDGGKDSGLL
ncbi:MAG: hypothetical protein AAB408_00530, partial [Patescibacteria group bacterium]